VYLRARRELVRPEDVGLLPGGRRRVSGLRREELAVLAGISTDYLVRLEQGRDQHPSEQVLDALARALGLGEDATAHLHRLAGPVEDRELAGRPEQVSASLRQLMDSWTTPANVQDRLMNVLHSNAMAVALSPIYAVGNNLLRSIFLDSEQLEVRRDWESLTAAGVAGLRAMTGPNGDDPDLQALVAELSEHSQRFRDLWNRHDVHPWQGGLHQISHPDVGDLDLYAEKFVVSGTYGRQMLAVYHAGPGSPTAERLERLARQVALAG
jgi:transcriptional regulator with XRE-family HTH domain